MPPAVPPITPPGQAAFPASAPPPPPPADLLFRPPSPSPPPSPGPNAAPPALPPFDTGMPPTPPLSPPLGTATPSPPPSGPQPPPPGAQPSLPPSHGGSLPPPPRIPPPPLSSPSPPPAAFSPPASPPLIGSPPLLSPPSGLPSPAASPPLSLPFPPTPQPPVSPPPKPPPVGVPNALPPPYTPPSPTQAGQPPQVSPPGNASAGPPSPPWLTSVSPPPDPFNWDSPDLLRGYHRQECHWDQAKAPALPWFQPVVAFQALVSFTEGIAVDVVAASLVKAISESVAAANVSISIAVTPPPDATRRLLFHMEEEDFPKRRLQAAMMSASFLLTVSFPATPVGGTAYVEAESFRTRVESQGSQLLSSSAYTVQSIFKVSFSLLDPTTQLLLPSPPSQVAQPSEQAMWASPPPFSGGLIAAIVVLGILILVASIYMWCRGPRHAYTGCKKVGSTIYTRLKGVQVWIDGGWRNRWIKLPNKAGLARVTSVNPLFEAPDKHGQLKGVEYASPLEGTLSMEPLIEDTEGGERGIIHSISLATAEQASSPDRSSHSSRQNLLPSDGGSTEIGDDWGSRADRCSLIQNPLGKEDPEERHPRAASNAMDSRASVVKGSSHVRGAETHSPSFASPRKSLPPPLKQQELRSKRVTFSTVASPPGPAASQGRPRFRSSGGPGGEASIPESDMGSAEQYLQFRFAGKDLTELVFEDQYSNPDDRWQAVESTIQSNDVQNWAFAQKDDQLHRDGFHPAGTHTDSNEVDSTRVNVISRACENTSAAEASAFSAEESPQVHGHSVASAISDLKLQSMRLSLFSAAHVSSVPQGSRRGSGASRVVVPRLSLDRLTPSSYSSDSGSGEPDYRLSPGSSGTKVLLMMDTPGGNKGGNQAVLRSPGRHGKSQSEFVAASGSNLHDSRGISLGPTAFGKMVNSLAPLDQVRAPVQLTSIPHTNFVNAPKSPSRGSARSLTPADATLHGQVSAQLLTSHVPPQPVVTHHLHNGSPLTSPRRSRVINGGRPSAVAAQNMPPHIDQALQAPGHLQDTIMSLASSGAQTNQIRMQGLTEYHGHALYTPARLGNPDSYEDEVPPEDPMQADLDSSSLAAPAGSILEGFPRTEPSSHEEVSHLPVLWAKGPDHAVEGLWNNSQTREPMPNRKPETVSLSFGNPQQPPAQISSVLLPVGHRDSAFQLSQGPARHASWLAMDTVEDDTSLPLPVRQCVLEGAKGTAAAEVVNSNPRRFSASEAGAICTGSARSWFVAAHGSTQAASMSRTEDADVCTSTTLRGELDRDPRSASRAVTNLSSQSEPGHLPLMHAAMESSALTVTGTPELPKLSQQAFSLVARKPSAWLQPSEGDLQPGTQGSIPAENLKSPYQAAVQAQEPHSEALQRMITTGSPSEVAQQDPAPSLHPHRPSRIDSPPVGANSLLRTQTSSPSVFRDTTSAGRHPHSVPLQRDRSLDLGALRKMGLLAGPKQDGIPTLARLSPRLQTAPAGASPRELGRYRLVPGQEGGVLQSYKSAIELSSVQQIVGPNPNAQLVELMRLVGDLKAVARRMEMKHAIAKLSPQSPSPPL
eukprot:jgi/Botrbrau1/12922/Bobra.92_1s0002.1